MSALAADALLRSALLIEGAETPTAVENAVRTFAEPLGYDRFVLFSASAGHDEVLQSIYWVEGDWFGDDSGIDAETYIRRCPVTRHILEVREPFFWTKTAGQDGERYRVTQAPRGRGLHGIQIPVFGPQGLEGAMSLGGGRIDASAQARFALGLIGATAFFATRRLLESPASETPSALSAREKEILAWTAAGRRQSEVAATLGLSERTVENHLRRIRKRLGVKTTAQAIRVAIRNGEIAA